MVIDLLTGKKIICRFKLNKYFFLSNPSHFSGFLIISWYGFIIFDFVISWVGFQKRQTCFKWTTLGISISSRFSFMPVFRGDEIAINVWNLSVWIKLLIRKLYEFISFIAVKNSHSETFFSKDFLKRICKIHRKTPVPESRFLKRLLPRLYKIL